MGKFNIVLIRRQPLLSWIPLNVKLNEETFIKTNSNKIFYIHSNHINNNLTIKILGMSRSFTIKVDQQSEINEFELYININTSLGYLSIFGLIILLIAILKNLIIGENIGALISLFLLIFIFLMVKVRNSFVIEKKKVD
jgi:hypothetical protein